MTRRRRAMGSRQFEEKQAVEKDLPKESLQDKHSLKVEKDNLKSEKEAFGAKEHKDKEPHKEKEKEKDKLEKEKEKEHKDKEKEHKVEKEDLLEKIPKTEGHEVYPQAQPAAAAPATVVHKALIDKFTNFEKSSKDKPEKIEIKEKIEFKEYKHEKFEKLEYDHLIGYGPGYGPPGGPVEQRLAALEAAVTQLLHFIPENLRPDLSQGALKQEPDAAKQGAAGTAKPSDAKEPQGKSKA
jgi:hypothetical protein